MAKINDAFSDLREKKERKLQDICFNFLAPFTQFFNMAYVEWREEDEGRREMPQERGFIPEYEGKQNTRLILDFEELSTKLQKYISFYMQFSRSVRTLYRHLLIMHSFRRWYITSIILSCNI